jgi:hypothetical protein
MQPLNRDDVLNLVKSRGPIIPNELKKLLKQGDTVLLGAMLSEAASKGQVKISSTKIGGSPFYYDPAQPEKLEAIAQHLNEKDRRTHALLKEQKVLRDDEHEALTRVSLRNIKDFSRELRVSTPDGEVIFWRYFLVPEDEAMRIIRGEEPKKQDLEIPKTQKEKAAESPLTTQTARQPESARQSAAPAVKKVVEEAIKTVSVQSIVEQEDEFIAELEPKKKTIKEKLEKKKRTEPKVEIQQPLPVVAPPPISDDFYTYVKNYFDKNGILIKEQKLVKKGELDFVILIPSPVGTMEYFCKAKTKKKSTDLDLAGAKLEGQSRNLPVLYLCAGEVTKKARDALTTTLKGVVVKEL